jgi:hypothetical protein
MTELLRQDQNTIDAFPGGIKLSEGDFATYANLFALRQIDERARRRPLGTYVEALQNAVLDILSTRTYEREFIDYADFACWLGRRVDRWAKRSGTETIDITPADVLGRAIRRRRPVRQQPVDSDNHYDPAVELTDAEAKRRNWNLRNANVHFDIAAIRSLSSSIRGVSRRSRHGRQYGVPYRGCGGTPPEISPRDLNFSLCIRYGIEVLGSMPGGLVSFTFPTREWKIAREVRGKLPKIPWTHRSSATGRRPASRSCEARDALALARAAIETLERRVLHRKDALDREFQAVRAMGKPTGTLPNTPAVKGSNRWYQEQMQALAASRAGRRLVVARFPEGVEADARSLDIILRRDALADLCADYDTLTLKLQRFRSEYAIAVQHLRAWQAQAAWCQRNHAVAFGHDRCPGCREAWSASHAMGAE